MTIRMDAIPLAYEPKKELKIFTSAISGLALLGIAINFSTILIA